MDSLGGYQLIFRYCLSLLKVGRPSSRYVTTVSQELLLHGEVETAAARSANRGGLTVVWPQAGEDIVLEEE